ncbi:MAG: anti-sigma F factor antagonist [Firmicutes bacterium]|nr:anti-sigma F factor antagonist [Bacillota bacterium]
MEVRLLGEKKTLLVKVSGELDHHMAAKIKEEVDNKLCSSNAKNIVFDFSGLTFMDSSGIGVIMGRYKKARTLGGRVIAYGINAQILRIMEMSGIDKIIKLTPTFEKAMRLLDK